MEKTVRVLDEQGNLLEATYPKRAKGLVKYGRARFVDEQTICLTCPPNRFLEETKMTTEEIKTIYGLEQIEILNRIEKIQHDNSHIMQALATLEKIPSNCGTETYAPEDVAGSAKAMAVAEVVKSREATNQKLLDFYMELYSNMCCLSVK